MPLSSKTERVHAEVTVRRIGRIEFKPETAGADEDTIHLGFPSAGAVLTIRDAQSLRDALDEAIREVLA